ncbi:MAG: hypothetical protein LKH74_04550 [Levilactobacillus sp.]|jgi:hypothetical protein|uniref:hypothetical protein n=1 Tax=Levilactobacillus sp. TaxID=2767919 RepID=UPI002585A90A|nr:hypothetical protein [Levilactobacillus sp.]MCI1553174.1 hypothetical protein [Levilactobacillus sp.]MCI1599266.1 hypothetical protein [Levilactobacillus sp.]MCI1605129.1 hypothetical protein [Levilactobacillus sp.]
MTIRKRLARLGNDQRHRFQGTFERYGLKAGYRGQEATILLREVRLLGNQQLMTDHLWFNLTKGFQKLGQLKAGDVIQFDGRVNSYLKGYQGNLFAATEIDYQVSWPTKITRISGGKRPPLPDWWELVDFIQDRNQA